ncbi:MAG: hypothetical protein JSR31_00825 [Nitrospira sp.]|nr:hypothetical protein [Nitrospira sp.]
MRISIALLIPMMWWSFDSSALAHKKEYFLLETARPKNVAVLKEQIRQEHLTLLGLTLGESTLSDVRLRFGETEPISVGHDGVVICYHSSNSKDDTLIAFGSDLHGDQKLINFQLMTGQQPFKGKEECSPSPLVSKVAETDSGLRLGLNAETVKNIMRAPMTETNGHLILDYDYQAATTFKNEPACLMVFASTAVRLEQSKVAWLLVTRGTEGYRGACKNQNNEKK